jgi:hypothetical protein
MVWTFLVTSKVLIACRSYVRYSNCPSSNFSSPQCLCLEALLTVSIFLSAISSFICGYLLFRSSNFQPRFSGHFHGVCDLPYAFAHRKFNNILRALVFLSVVLEVCVRMGCDAASLSKYFPAFMIKNCSLILLDQNTFLNVSTLECETTASSRNAGNQLRTNCRLVIDQRKDTSGKTLYSGTPRKIWNKNSVRNCCKNIIAWIIYSTQQARTKLH